VAERKHLEEHTKLASALWVRRWVSAGANPVVDVPLELGDFRGAHQVGVVGARAVRDLDRVGHREVDAVASKEVGNVGVGLSVAPR
jgi:hypothetical protein